MNLFDDMPWSSDIRVLFLWTISLTGVGILMHILSVYLRESKGYVSFIYFVYEGLFSPVIADWIGAGSNIILVAYYTILFILLSTLIILTSRFKVLFYLLVIIYALLIIPLLNLPNIYI